MEKEEGEQGDDDEEEVFEMNEKTSNKKEI